MKMSFGRKTMVGAIGTFVAVGIGLMVLAAAGIAGWEYTNSDQFCENVCHAVHPEEIDHRTRQRRTRACSCVECHMGRNLDAAHADRDEAHPRQGAVGNDRRLRAPGRHASACARRATACEACH